MTLRSRISTTTIASLTAALAVAAVASTPASAAAPDTSGARKLSDGVLAPFQVTVQGKKVFYTDGFAGTVTKIGPKGGKTVVAKKPDVSGVAVSGKQLAMASGGGPASVVTIRRPGRRTIIAHPGAFEYKFNPDGTTTYGVIAGGNTCANDFLAKATELPATYTGIKDSHPYQLASLPGGAWAVAEAGGNDILKINKRGFVSLLAVLPRQPHTFTAANAKAVGAPDCVVGVTYAWEPVATDVERDARGNLWVSTLPGGPEGPALGARGSVYKITKKGKVTRVATGFLGATNLAVVKGKVYVAELFGGRVSTIRRGKIVTAISIARPVSVEATKHKLYVGQLADTDEKGNVKSPGAVYRFPR